MDCSIIVISWNVRDELRRCLTSVYRTTPGTTYEVWVIDNASADDSVAMVKKEFSQVRLIANSRNEGFAAACNQAIKQASGDTILLLNPDTELQPDTLMQALRALERQPSVGILGCHLMNPDGSTQPSVRRFPDVASHVLILLKLHHVFGRARSLQQYFWLDFDYSKPRTVDQVMGAFFLIRRAVIDEIGPLDEKFYIWYEEVDYCTRALAKGWTTYYTPTATCVHQRGASFRQRQPLTLQRIFNRSMIRYFDKHGPRGSVVLLRLLYPVSLCLAGIQQALGGRRSHNHQST